MNERTEVLRQPPFSIEAEQEVLGRLLLDPARIESVATILAESDFYRRDHQAIYAAMLSLSGRGITPDAVTLADVIGGEVGAYLIKLANETAGTAQVDGYARMVRDKALRRSLIEAGTELVSRAFANEGETPELIADAIGGLMAMQKTEARSEYTLRQAMSLAYKAAQEAKSLGGRIPGITSGLGLLDKILGGWHDSDLIVIGARPAMGKTALLVKFALAANVPCGIISAEQPAMQIGARVMSAEAKVSASKLRNGAYDNDDIASLRAAVERLVERECVIYDRSSPSIADVTRMARKWKQQNGIRLLLVDYIQRIESSGDKRAAKHERVGEVVRGLKSLARDLEIPVIALCQVGRQVESRPNKRPSMGDMSDSSEIEKEADQILTLYREEVYYDAEGVNENGHRTRTGIAEINVEKNRHGPDGYVECAWLAETMRFENLIHAA